MQHCNDDSSCNQMHTLYACRATLWPRTSSPHVPLQRSCNSFFCARLSHSLLCLLALCAIDSRLRHSPCSVRIWQDVLRYAPFECRKRTLDLSIDWLLLAIIMQPGLRTACDLYVSVLHLVRLCTVVSCRLSHEHRKLPMPKRIWLHAVQQALPEPRPEHWLTAHGFHLAAGTLTRLFAPPSPSPASALSSS